MFSRVIITSGPRYSGPGFVCLAGLACPDRRQGCVAGITSSRACEAGCVPACVPVGETSCEAACDAFGVEVRDPTLRPAPCLPGWPVVSWLLVPPAVTPLTMPLSRSRRSRTVRSPGGDWGLEAGFLGRQPGWAACLGPGPGPGPGSTRLRAGWARWAGWAGSAV